MTPAEFRAARLSLGLTARLAEVEAERDDWKRAYRSCAADGLALTNRAEAAEARAYTLAVAIMGGEDAPGYADSIHADHLAAQLRKERASRDEWTDACVKAALSTAREDALRDAAEVADGYHKRALEWAKTVRGLEKYIGETDSSRIAAAILALIDNPEQTP